MNRKYQLLSEFLRETQMSTRELLKWQEKYCLFDTIDGEDGRTYIDDSWWRIWAEAQVISRWGYPLLWQAMYQATARILGKDEARKRRQESSKRERIRNGGWGKDLDLLIADTAK